MLSAWKSFFRKEERRYDVALVSDLQFLGGTSSSNAQEIRIQHAAGLKTALFHVPSTLIGRRQKNNQSSNSAMPGSWVCRSFGLQDTCLCAGHNRATPDCRNVKEVSASRIAHRSRCSCDQSPATLQSQSRLRTCYRDQKYQQCIWQTAPGPPDRTRCRESLFG